MVQLIVLVAFIIIAAYVNMKEKDLFNRVILCLLIALIAFVLGYCYKHSEIYNEPTARDENGDLNLFRIKPYRVIGGYYIADTEDHVKSKMRINRELFPDVTFSTGPVEVILCPNISSEQFEKEVFKKP